MTDMLGKYELQAELGRGAFATVYRALDTTLDRPVALKILHPQLLTDPVFVQRFQQEAKLMANLRHPHICTVFEVAQSEGQIYIAMQLAAGPNLAQAINEQGAFTLDQTLEMLAPLCQALDYAHRQKIVHRDLKPANILLDRELGPLLTDFGFARLVSLNSVSFSLSGGVIGTPAYIAPEVWELDVAEPAADIYALGCIIYEMLTGAVLFAGPTPMQVMRAHDRGPALAAETLAGLPTGLEAVLRKALAREPAARYGSATTLWHAVQDLKREAQAAQEAAAQAELVAQWRAETEAAIEAEEWRAAKMAVSRWLALAPDDPAAQTAQAEIEQRLSAPPPGPPSPLESTPIPKPKEERSAERPAPPSPAPAPKPQPPRPRASAWLWLGGVVGLIVLSMIGFSVLGGGGAQPETVTVVETVIVEKEKGVTVEVEPEGEEIASSAPASPPDVGSTRQREADGMTMVYVPAGSFMMGSDESEFLAQDDEKPQHPVTLAAFWLDQTEVTVAMFRQFVEDTGHETTAEQEGSGWVYTSAGEWQLTDGANWQHPFGPDSDAEDNHPVVQVSWQDANAYCDWAGGRLPTEAEWEYAARGPDSLIYPWGNEFDGAKLNYCDATCELDWKDESVDDGYKLTAPVGSYPAGASWVGALDLSGNVWEWVNDRYGSDYYTSSPENNPPGPESGEYRVLRGGGWGHYVRGVRAAIRVVNDPDNRIDFSGFRCVGSPGN